jgi:hypothetical protein
VKKVRPLTQEVVDLLNDNDVKNDEILDKLSLIYEDIEKNLWESIEISPAIFYNLKDVVWYNLEHIPNDGVQKGGTTLEFLGTKYPNFIYCCNESDIIKKDNLPSLLEEIEEIIAKWDKNWRFASLFTRSTQSWKGGRNDEPSKVIIYDANSESPSQYGYNKQYSTIVDSKGDSIKKYGINTVLCSLGETIGQYTQGKILYNVLIKVREKCKDAIRNKKGLKFNFIQNQG